MLQQKENESGRGKTQEELCSEGIFVPHPYYSHSVRLVSAVSMVEKSLIYVTMCTFENV